MNQRRPHYPGRPKPARRFSSTSCAGCVGKFEVNLFVRDQVEFVQVRQARSMFRNAFNENPRQIASCHDLLRWSILSFGCSANSASISESACRPKTKSG
jgi:hypothetical protein